MENRQRSNFELFTAAIGRLSKFFGPCQDITEWYTMFKHENLDRINEAINHILRTHKFKTFPLPNDMKDALEATRQTYVSRPINRPESNEPLATPEELAACKAWMQTQINTGKTPRGEPCDFFKNYPNAKPVISQEVDKLFF